MSASPAALIRPPHTLADWGAYNALRHSVLRQPWQQPPGSERCPADADSTTVHALLPADEPGPAPAAWAVGMLQRLDAQQGQIRFMAVAPAMVGTGLGRQIVAYLEHQARAMGLTEIILHARETAVGFYARLGYEMVGPSHTLFGVLPHFLMRKLL